jgi:sulfate permease, SulP family
MELPYGWSSFRKDLIAGLTVAAIAVPQAMAYALIAGLDPRIGLYTAIVMTAVASVFGSSLHLINGPTNAISLVVFSALAFLPAAATLEDRYEAVFLLAIMVGVFQMAVALFRLGDLTRYISESVILGFMAGAGFLVALSQVRNLLGLKERGTGHHHLLYRLWLTLTSDGQWNLPTTLRTLSIGLGTIVLVVTLRRLARKYRLPRVDMLLVLILAASLTALFGWDQKGPDGNTLVAVVGEVKGDLPTPHLPAVPGLKLLWERVQQMGGSAAAIALLGLLEALAIAKSIAVRTRQPLDYNRQCLAEGLANFCGGLFRCMPGSGSLTRSAINFQAGAVSRWSGVFSAIAVALGVVLLARLARYIPLAALAGILFVTAAGLIDGPRVRYALRASRYDAILVGATAFAAVFISVEFSILIGMALSILMYVPRVARLHATELTISPGPGDPGAPANGGRGGSPTPGVRIVRERQPADPPCTGMVLFDLEGELFFGAAPDLDRLLDDLKKRTKAGLRIIILHMKRTRNPDVVCMDRFQHFLQEMKAGGVTVLLCGVREDFAQAMKNLHFHDWMPAGCVFREDSADSSTLAAVRRAYEILGPDVCAHCPRNGGPEPDKEVLYYMI